MTTARARNYAGLSADERRLARRERLIEGAIRAYGELGYRNTTVKAVCEAAGLTERYFYESFANSEALLVAAFDTVSRRVFTPVPRVDSALVAFERSSPLPADAAWPRISQVVHAAFAHRRKLLANSLELAGLGPPGWSAPWCRSPRNGSGAAMRAASMRLQRTR